MRISALGIAFFLLLSCLLPGCGYKTNPRPAAAGIPGEVGPLDTRAFPDSVVLRWDVPPFNTDGSRFNEVSGFKIYRSARKIGEECDNCDEKKNMYVNVDFQNPSNAVVNNGEVTFTDTNVPPGNVYVYSVSAYNLRGKEGNQSQDTKVVLDEPPAAPTNLRAFAEPLGVKLEWAHPVDRKDIQNYKIYRSTTDKISEFKSIGGTKWGETYFVDKDPEKGHINYYFVRSLKIKGEVSFESEPSSTAQVILPKSQAQSPENVAAAVAGQGIRVQWDPLEVQGGRINYNIYRAETGDQFKKINSTPVSDAGYFDRNVDRGNSYRYGVTSFPEGNPQEESSRSASAAVKFSP